MRHLRCLDGSPGKADAAALPQAGCLGSSHVRNPITPDADQPPDPVLDSAPSVHATVLAWPAAGSTPSRSATPR